MCRQCTLFAPRHQAAWEGAGGNGLLPAFLPREHVRGIRRAVGQLLQGLRTEVAYVIAGLVVASVVGDARFTAVDLGLLPRLPAFGATEEAAYGDALGGERAVVGASLQVHGLHLQVPSGEEVLEYLPHLAGAVDVADVVRRGNHVEVEIDGEVAELTLVESGHIVFRAEQ